MKSIRSQLLVTLVATAVAAGTSIHHGPLPDMNLHQAAESGNVIQIKRNIRWGQDVNVRAFSGHTPLHWAACGEHLRAVRFLIAEGADVKAKDGDCGDTPLHYVSDRSVAQLLIVSGAEINAKNKQGRTPLHDVLNKGVAVLLIAEGADVNAKDDIGSTPLHCRDYVDSTPYDLVDDKGIPETLIAGGADIDAKNNSGWTPLHAAVDSGRHQYAEVLIAHGANVNARDHKKRTLLQIAIANRHVKIAALLRRHGARE